MGRRVSWLIVLQSSPLLTPSQRWIHSQRATGTLGQFRRVYIVGRRETKEERAEEDQSRGGEKESSRRGEVDTMGWEETWGRPVN